MEVIERLEVLIKFFEFGNHIYLHNGAKVYMKEDGRLYIQRKNRKEKNFNPTYNELLQLTKSISNEVFSKILNVVNFSIYRRDMDDEKV